MGGFNQNPVSVSLFLFVVQVFLAQSCSAADTIRRGESIRDGQTLVSSDQTFELGFFSPGASTRRYLGIWYNKIDRNITVWIANRDNPISSRTGALTFSDDGNLVILDGSNNTIWSSEAKIGSNRTAAKLMDSSNFVLTGSDQIGVTDNAYWQSFEHPTDTFLPGMRVRVNHKAGENRPFVSWKSESDPSTGNYFMGVDPTGAPQIVVWEGRRRLWRSGQWNSAIFTGVPSMTLLTNYLYGFKLSSPPDSDGSVYFTYVPSNPSTFLRFQIGYDGKEAEYRWAGEEKQWRLIQSQPANECEMHNHCGNFGVCNVLSDVKCSCVDSFEPKFPLEWSKGNWSGGCARRTPLQCQRNNSGGGEKDGFSGLKNMKLPDFGAVEALDVSESCRDKCLKNCSCNAYAEVGGIGCMMWTEDLIDIQHFTNGGSLLHIRVADSELGKSKKISSTVVIVIVTVGTSLLGIIILLLWIFKEEVKAMYAVSCCKNYQRQIVATTNNSQDQTSKEFSGSVDLLIEGKEVNASELPIFSFNVIRLATNNFSAETKLGYGGFGSVYKGELHGGQEIAVKRLSAKSGQGQEEFKNEIILIAKLQHRNLVRLLGCCIEGEEKMIVYEYMPNKSLDFFLFVESRRALLDWKKRFEIIEGVARGLLYLHRDSRLRIIHRDMKASNILLDAEMNPRISDFGMARIFGGNQIEGNTDRVVGTYGYMSPEYAMEGLFSVKSDVYSFGVLLLEIISGRRNTSFRLSEDQSLIFYAWNLWNHGRALDLVDPTIRSTCSRHEVLRCVHVAMLCVQDSALQRPDMASVLLMLESEASALPLPRQPTFASTGSSITSIDTDFNLGSLEAAACSDLSITMVVGR